MPINANLLGAMARPVRSVQDYEDNYMRRDIAQQGMQRNALAMQESQANMANQAELRAQAAAQRNALSAAYGSLKPGATQADIESALFKNPLTVQRGYELQKDRVANEKLTAETAGLNQKRGIDGDHQARMLLQAAKNPTMASDMVRSAVEQKLWTPERGQSVLDGMPIDLTQWDEWRNRQLAPAMAPKDILPATSTRNTGSTTDTLSTDLFSGVPRVTSSAPITQDANSIASNATQRRGQNLTDARARDFNAVQVEANNIKRAEVTQGKDLTKNSQLASFDTMLGTLDRLAKHPGLSKSVGIPGVFPTMPGSNSANFQAELNTFQSQAFLPMVAQLKGMGALSDAEGKKLTAAVGALDPKMGEVAFRESVDRITEEMTAARERVAGTGGAPKRAATAGGNSVTTPDGRVHTFPNAAAAAQFKKAAGL